MNKKAVIGLGLTALVIAVVLVVYTPTPQESSNHLGGTMGVKLVIQVHRTDGTTETYVKEGDLILKNFAKFLVGVMIYDDPEQEDRMNQMDGDIQYSNTYWGYRHAVIWIGSSNSSVSISDTNMNDNNAIGFCIQDADIFTNGNDITVDIMGSYTVNENVTIGEIGLALSPGGTSNGCYVNHNLVLIFHDVLSDPIELNAGDGITIHYYIYLDNP